MRLDPHTPVVVGVGQAAERIDDPYYRAMSAVELATAAARAALEDCGADAAKVAAAIDTVAGVRQFEISGPAQAVLGKSNNYPRSVARRIDADPGRAILEIVGGQGPQHLINELAGEIARGRSEVTLIFGSDATSTTRYFAGSDNRPDFSETVEGSLEDRGHGLEGLISRYTVIHGLVDAPTQYALLENARRAGTGLGPAEYLRSMGELFAPFTKVAAGNPFAAAPVERSVEELITVTESNRMIAEPYPRLLVARDQVNQGAAALLMSVGAAQRLGVPQENWVYLHGYADLAEQSLLDRPDLGHAPSAVLAVREALRVAGIGIDDVATFDLYSCFPVAVFNICDGMGIAPDDPRGLTLTGGLPFFGGAGNNYSMHGVAETVVRMRSAPGQFGLVGANGGIMSKYSVGVYSTTPVEWKPDRSAQLQAEIDAWPKVAVTEHPDGGGVVETYTVRRDNGRLTGIIVGRLDADETRFLATTEDEGLIALLTDGDPLGQPISVRSLEYGNRCRL
ncbi:acetyl-CoA acetyltransferase [Mycobacterium heckeshornense]|uniref:Acetyl-CoA acetyltransferase n=1 Tax=Mycobacterium heckeshornense TaxID=110505 RepID=A0A2G8B9L3_9MYCO|nr:acetyl-CoA acetyltransferase [Mycobacterium heckeshornense]KMV23850.1 acetyl-CoA acetyltransferase [Mycobacterium heckeshornense]MCV7033370.1 acetyl-CoA acetyltransferase [Mycobacterium heckeshornense]PIJ34451.1 acetyl-CoA acetyltransferase [Mycobacterium heckeshornense]BCO34609.1 acetyl-CoA acetyltransferase [Mycobacterium heckeshornense]